MTTAQKVRASIIVFGGVVVFAVLLFLLEIYGFSDEAAEHVHVWMQFITGPWPTWEGIVSRKSVEFAVVVTIRCLLIVGVVGAMVTTLRRLVTFERRQFVHVLDLLDIRDITVIQEMLNRLKDVPEENQLELIGKLRDAFKAANDSLDEQISIILGISLEKATSIRRDFQKSSIGALTTH